MRIDLIRHGLTEWNKAQKMQGWFDSPLSSEGEQQALQLNKRYKSEYIDKIYCSISGRAIQTAKILVGDKNIFIETLEDLREIKLGPWEGQELEWVKEHYGEMYDNFWHNPQLFSVEDCENFNQLRKRSSLTIQQCIDRSYKEGHEHIIILSHCAYISSYLNYIQGESLDKVWQEPHVKPTSVTILEYNPELQKPNIITIADISHYGLD